MAFLFRKFQEAAKTLATSPMFTRDPRKLQFETDMNRLFLYTCYHRLGRNANEKDVDEIIDMATKASVADQQKQVQENIHSQIRNLCAVMDDILLPEGDKVSDICPTTSQHHSGNKRSGLSFAIGTTSGSRKLPVCPETRPFTRLELSAALKIATGYTLDIKQSQIPHEQAGQGLFLSGEAYAGAVVAFYPGVIYSPAYYQCIPGYPMVDACNSYLITRYDGHVINAQPWGEGGDNRQMWSGFYDHDYVTGPAEGTKSGSDWVWKLLSKPVRNSQIRDNYGKVIEMRNPIRDNYGKVIEMRNPVAYGHFANHPGRGMSPNVMVCPYDFPMTEEKLRTYIPNVVFGDEDNVKMKRFGSFWFNSGRRADPKGEAGAVIRSLVLVATRALCDEEVLLNYRLSNSKKRPAWYTAVDEEEDRRRWS